MKTKPFFFNNANQSCQPLLTLDTSICMEGLRHNKAPQLQQLIQHLNTTASIKRFIQILARFYSNAYRNDIEQRGNLALYEIITSYRNLYRAQHTNRPFNIPLIINFITNQFYQQPCLINDIYRIKQALSLTIDEYRHHQGSQEPTLIDIPRYLSFLLCTRYTLNIPEQLYALLAIDLNRLCQWLNTKASIQARRQLRSSCWQRLLNSLSPPPSPWWDVFDRLSPIGFQEKGEGTIDNAVDNFLKKRLSPTIEEPTDIPTYQFRPITDEPLPLL